MADRGFEVLEDGRMIEVEAKDLSEDDKGKSFLCCDNPRGVPCLAKLTLVVRAGGKKFFAARGQPGHKPFCQFNKSTEYRRLAHIDPTGAGDKPDTILDRFNHENFKTHGVRHTSGDRTKEKNDPGEDYEEENRIIQRVPGRPNSLKELVLMLLSLSEEDYYAGVRVRDFLLDHRSIRGFRKNGLDEGQVAIAICAKTTQGRELRN